MRTLFIALLLLTAPQVKRQTNYSYLCRKDVQFDLRYIWTESYMFKQEYALAVQPDTTKTATDHLYDHVNITGNRQTIAVIHTHTAGLEAWPSDDDIVDAKRTGVPVFVLSVENRTLIAALPDGKLERVTKLDADLKPQICQ